MIDETILSNITQSLQYHTFYSGIPTANTLHWYSLSCYLCHKLCFAGVPTNLLFDESSLC